MPQNNLPSWFETPDLMQLAIVLLFGAFIWFAIRTLRQVDKNQEKMTTRLENLERDFYTLRGEHNAVHGREVDK